MLANRSVLSTLPQHTHESLQRANWEFQRAWVASDTLLSDIGRERSWFERETGQLSLRIEMQLDLKSYINVFSTEIRNLFDATQAILNRLETLESMVSVDRGTMSRAFKFRSFTSTELIPLSATDLGDKRARDFISKYGGTEDCVSWAEQQTEWLNCINTWKEDEIMSEARKNLERWEGERKQFVTVIKIRKKEWSERRFLIFSLTDH